MFNRPYYATSFEESILLTNFENSYLLEVLKDTMPRIYGTIQNRIEDEERAIKDYSYEIQFRLGDSSRKSKFSSKLLYTLIVNDDNNIKLPKYIEDGFQWLKGYLDTSRKG